MTTYEATYTVNVTVDNEADLTKVEKALEDAAKSVGTDVSVNEDNVNEIDDTEE